MGSSRCHAERAQMTYPYTQGWPTDPFKQLTPQEMAALLKRMGKPEYEEALI